MLFARFLAENDLLLHPGGRPGLARRGRASSPRRRASATPGCSPPATPPRCCPASSAPTTPPTGSPSRPRTAAASRPSSSACPHRCSPPTTPSAGSTSSGRASGRTRSTSRGDKIGGADLPPVTQLFTEHYMVRFLLENSLGAWWAGRHPDSPLLREWEYLRFRDDGTPAAGTFEGWPARAAEVTVMDPCCGSGHFLVAAAEMLRQDARGGRGAHRRPRPRTPSSRDNLFGLELDARCLQLAAFNLALDAWKAGGYQPLPVPNLACSGIADQGPARRLAPPRRRRRQHGRAPSTASTTCSRTPPSSARSSTRGAAAGRGPLGRRPRRARSRKLDQALRRETAADPAAAVFGAAAAGTAKAAELLAGRYWLVATNPPFLGVGSRSTVCCSDSAEQRYRDARADLATTFLQRAWSLLGAGGAVALVTPQNWLVPRPIRRAASSAASSSTIGSIVAYLGERRLRTHRWRGREVVLPRHHDQAAIDSAATSSGIDRRSQSQRPAEQGARSSQRALARVVDQRDSAGQPGRSHRRRVPPDRAPLLSAVARRPTRDHDRRLRTLRAVLLGARADSAMAGDAQQSAPRSCQSPDWSRARVLLGATAMR